MTNKSSTPTIAASVCLRVVPGVDVGRPIRAAVLSNPLGGFNQRRRNMDKVRRAVGAFSAPHIEVSAPADVFAAVRGLIDDGTELLVINGGDGTIQMALTALFSGEPFATSPLLAVVAGGTSNTIPGDIGWMKRPPEAIRTVLAAAQRGRLDGHLAERSVMRIESSRWTQPMCAMQFSAGAIYNAIKFAKSAVEGRGAHGQAGPAVTVAWFILNVITGRAKDLFPPLHLAGTIDGMALRGGEHLGIVATTLDHLFLGIRPFWGEGPGRVRYTALGYRPRHLLRALLPALRGEQGRFVTPANGYESRNAENLVLEIDGGFTLDGELFEAAPGTIVTVSAPVSAYFLRAGAP